MICSATFNKNHVGLTDSSIAEQTGALLSGGSATTRNCLFLEGTIENQLLLLYRLSLKAAEN